MYEGLLRTNLSSLIPAVDIRHNDFNFSFKYYWSYVAAAFGLVESAYFERVPKFDAPVWRIH